VRFPKAVTLLLLALICSLAGSVPAASAAASVQGITLHPDELATVAPFMGLGVELDPYDSVNPTPAQWSLIFQRLDYMRPGFVRVVEPASDYFGGYDAAHNPVYRWTAPHVVQLLTILAHAKSRGITVVLGDWGNPMINGDARIPADFLQQLHDVYGYTNIRYYNLINEPNGVATCDFGCWTNIVSPLSAEFASLGLNSWLQLVGPDNANSWDDTATAQALDRSSGLDTDNPLGGDSWITATLHAIPSLIAAYDSHRYATIWGIENGVFGDQMRSRREQINNVDAPTKPYFDGEVGITARQLSPFTARFNPNTPRIWAPLMDPSATPRASAFVDSQPNIEEFGYGVWMGDMMIQAISAGLSGASAWDLDDAMHVGGQYGSQNLKQWGFWNSLGGEDGYPTSDLALRPWYYPWAVLARSFPAGSQPLVTPASGVPGVRIAAARILGAHGYYFSFAAVNDSDTPQSITISVPSVMAPVTLARYDYFSGDRPVDANGFPVPAQVLPGVQLAGGLTVGLPSRGLAVLSSLGAGAAARPSQGRSTLLDDLIDWRRVRARSKGLTLDRSNPVQFNEDGSRATVTANAKGVQFLIYRAQQITSFELKAYYAKAPALSAYRSQDGNAWTPVSVASTNPAATVGGQHYLAEILPNEPIPAGTNRLKIVIAKGTELGQVAIEARRAGPACLAPDVQAGRGALGGIALGAGQRRVRGLFGVASVSGARTWRYCVIGGGELAVVFARRSVASLIASSARSARISGIGPGSSVGSLLGRFGGHGGVRSIAGRGLIATTRQGPVVFVTHAGHVQAVAIASPALLNSNRSLLRAIKQAHLTSPSPPIAAT
jgi:hypothetical protein